MKNYPDNFKSECDPNEIEDVYNGPDPGLTECVYAGPEYFRNGNVFEPEPDKKISSTIVQGAKYVKDALKKK